MNENENNETITCYLRDTKTAFDMTFNNFSMTESAFKLHIKLLRRLSQKQCHTLNNILITFALHTRAVRYVMCTVPQRDNAMHVFVDDDRFEQLFSVTLQQNKHVFSNPHSFTQQSQSLTTIVEMVWKWIEESELIINQKFAQNSIIR